MQPSAIPPRTSSASFTNGHHHHHHAHHHHSWSSASASASGSGPATPRHRSTISTASGDWLSQRSPPPPPGHSYPTHPSAHLHHHLHRHASPPPDSQLRPPPPPTAPPPARSETAPEPDAGKMTAESGQPQQPQPQQQHQYQQQQGLENENETEPKSKNMCGERGGREQEEEAGAEAKPEGEPAEPEAGRAPPPQLQSPSPPHPQHHHQHHHQRQPQNQPSPQHHHHRAQQPDPDPGPDPGRFRTLDLDFAHRPGGWTDEKERALRGPYDYLHDKPGKDFRTQLINAFDAWLEVPPRSLAVITRVVGMLHTASLLVDDVEDSSSLRRGLPVAHSIFGVAQTINSSNYMYFCALGELASLRPAGAAVAIFADELVNLHRGQGMDLFWRDTLACPSEDDYLEMVDNKTGGLLRLGIKLMQDEAGAAARQAGRQPGPDCVPLGNLIGLIYQIRDDYMNLSSADYTTNKGLCEDLTEGKFSFPIIHAIRADRANTQLVNILRQKPTDADVKRYAVAYMDRVGSFEYTRRVLRVLVDRARALTDQIDGGRGRAAGVHRILDTISV